MYGGGRKNATRKSGRKGARKGGKRNGTMKGGAMKWHQMVKKVHAELKKKKKDASLGDAMKEASKRKKAGKL